MPMSSMRYVIVGAGLSGHQAALELARLDPGASITLVGEEDGVPYDRPPLSKKVLLSDEASPPATTLPSADAYRERGIVHRALTRAVAIDRAAGVVSTSNGEDIGFDRLLLATGSRPRDLPCLPRNTAPTGTYLRSREEAEGLREKLASAPSVVVIGGGFIGLEVAAAARQRGCTVRLLEASPRLLSRGMPRSLSDWILQLHRSRGVDIHLSSPVNNIWSEASGGYIIETSSGNLFCDVVIIGIGVIPEVSLAEHCSLHVSDGIVVDDHCRTSDERIFASGEVTAHPSWPDARLRRIEAWRTSLDHGIAAASNMTGKAKCFDSIPWFWSDQFEHNIQSIGFPDEAVSFEIREDSTDTSWLEVGVDATGTVVGAVAVNRGRDISILKRTMAQPQKIPARTGL